MGHIESTIKKIQTIQLTFIYVLDYQLVCERHIQKSICELYPIINSNPWGKELKQTWGILD